ncbi:MAG: hypothetical protein ACLTZN_01350 [Streptococcus sp.]
MVGVTTSWDVGLISSSFTVSKVVRDNQEDEENYNKLIAQQTFEQ